MLRGILGIIAGWLAWGALAVPCTALLTSLFPANFAEDGSTRHTGMLAAMLALSVFYSLTAGAVTALIASEEPGKYVWGLAIVNLATGILVQSSAWNMAPAWYHIIFLILVVPATLSGGRLGMRVKLRPQSA